MYVEIPECRRCCCCFPLRRGILVFGYIGTVVSLLWFIFELVLSGMDFLDTTVTLHKGVSFIVQSWVALLLCAIDVAFNIVLVIGAHQKNTRLLRVYFYYGVTTLLASFILFLVTRTDVYHNLWFIHVTESTFAVCWFVLQIFILLLVRSEIKKLKQNSGLRFVNHVSEVIIDVPVREGHNPF